MQSLLLELRDFLHKALCLAQTTSMEAQNSVNAEKLH